MIIGMLCLLRLYLLLKVNHHSLAVGSKRWNMTQICHKTGVCLWIRKLKLACKAKCLILSLDVNLWSSYMAFETYLSNSDMNIVDIIYHTLSWAIQYDTNWIYKRLRNLKICLNWSWIKWKLSTFLQSRVRILWIL